MGNGRLTHLDARGAMTASWTFADDKLFGAWGIVPARKGGVWLWGGSTIAWFDGKRFRDVIAAPATASPASWIVDVGEAPDGSLWAAANAGPTDGPAIQGTVSHWDGTSWTPVCRPRPSDTIAHLAVDAAGGVWVAPDHGYADVTRFDGTTWSIPPSDPAWTADQGGVNAWPASLVAADDGSLWFAYGGLGHFQGKTWTSAGTDGVDLSGTVSLAAAPDGSAWLATGSVNLPGDTWGPHTGIAIAHRHGRSWTVYDSADGLPAPEPNRPTITAVAASSQTVIAATRDGFYRLSGDRWVRAGPPPTRAPAWVQRMLAVSAREAWIPAEDGLWHVRDGTSTTVPVAGWTPPMRAFDVDLAPDGTLAVATDKGTAILRDGRWTVLGREETQAVTIASDGAIWVGERTSDGAQTTVASFRLDGRAWVRNALPAIVAEGASPSLLILPSDGEAWLLSWGWVPMLHRFDGTGWTRGSQLGEYHLGDIRGLALAPNGDLVALASAYDGTDWTVARYDGALWTVNHASDGLAQPGNVLGPGGIAIAPDGSSWVATDRGLAHFDGRRWSLHFAGEGFHALSFAPDGTLWAVGPSGVQRLPAGLLVEPDPAAR